MYDNGIGVAENDISAVDWYLKAAEQGYAQAQYNLAVAYCSGTGTLKDQPQCIFWAQKAEENGKDIKELLEKYAISIAQNTVLN